MACIPPLQVPGQSGSVFKFRSLRTAHQVQVVPLLLPRPVISTCAGDLAAFRMAMDLDAAPVSDVRIYTHDTGAG